MSNKVKGNGSGLFDKMLKNKYKTTSTITTTNTQQYNQPSGYPLTNTSKSDKYAYVDNTQNARNMYLNSNGFNTKFVRILSIFLTLFSLGYIVAITFIPIPPDSQRYADTCLGFILGTMMSTVVNFWLGSSIPPDYDIFNNRNK